MSCSTLYKVYRTTARGLIQFRNGYGSGPPVWEMVAAKLGLENPSTVAMFGSHEARKVWNAVRGTEIPLSWKWALAFTFDKTILNPEDTEIAANAFRETHQDILRWTRYTWSHWESIADAIEGSPKLDYRALGFALGCTSVSDPWEDFIRSSDRADETDMINRTWFAEVAG